MNHDNTLVPFSQNGLELIINNITGESIAKTN